MSERCGHCGYVHGSEGCPNSSSNWRLPPSELDALRARVRELEGNAASLADTINQELRERGGQVQIRSASQDFRPFVKALVDATAKTEAYRVKELEAENARLKAIVDKLQEIWLTPGQDEWPGKTVIRTLDVAGTYLRGSCGEFGLALGNIILKLAGAAEGILAAARAEGGGKCPFVTVVEKRHGNLLVNGFNLSQWGKCAWAGSIPEPDEPKGEKR